MSLQKQRENVNLHLQHNQGHDFIHVNQYFKSSQIFWNGKPRADLFLSAKLPYLHKKVKYYDITNYQHWKQQNSSFYVDHYLCLLAISLKMHQSILHVCHKIHIHFSSNISMFEL